MVKWCLAMVNGSTMYNSTSQRGNSISGEGIVILMENVGWKRVSLISTVGGDYGELGRGIRASIRARKAEGFRISRWFQDIGVGPSPQAIRDIYAKVKTEARSKTWITHSGPHTASHTPHPPTHSTHVQALATVIEHEYVIYTHTCIHARTHVT